MPLRKNLQQQANIGFSNVLLLDILSWYWGSSINVLGGGSPRIGKGDIQVCNIDDFLYGWLIDRWMRRVCYSSDWMEAIKPPKKCLILTDRLISVKTLLSRKLSHRTHPLVYDCKQMCSNLLWNGVEVKLMWIPSHVGLVGTELVNERAWHRRHLLNLQGSTEVIVTCKNL
jgi:hypothetical protein